MQKIFYHGVLVRFNDGKREIFRYDTEEQARNAEHYQFVDNWQKTRSAIYVGRRIHWAGLWRYLLSR